jgi:hypothetical protein
MRWHYVLPARREPPPSRRYCFLLNGGLGFIYFFRDWWQSRRSFIQFWNTLSFNYANLSERGIHWNNIVADIMVPQRTSLFGLSIGLMIFTIFAIVWQRWHASEGTEASQRQPHSLTLMVIAGMLAGSLPYFHTHTYIAAGFVSVILFAMRPRREWIGFWAPAVLLATPQIFWLALHARGGPGIVRVFFGWLGHEEPFFPLYLLRNFGLPSVARGSSLAGGAARMAHVLSRFSAPVHFYFCDRLFPKSFRQRETALLLARPE